MRGLTLAALAILLGGCMTVEEQAAMNRLHDQERCAAFGYQPGSAAFADCMMTMSVERDRAHLVRDVERRHWEADRRAAYYYRHGRYRDHRYRGRHYDRREAGRDADRRRRETDERSRGCRGEACTPLARAVSRAEQTSGGRSPSRAPRERAETRQETLQQLIEMQRE